MCLLTSNRGPSRRKKVPKPKSFDHIPSKPSSLEKRDTALSLPLSANVQSTSFVGGWPSRCQVSRAFVDRHVEKNWTNQKLTIKTSSIEKGDRAPFLMVDMQNTLSDGGLPICCWGNPFVVEVRLLKCFCAPSRQKIDRTKYFRSYLFQNIFHREMP